MALRRRVTRQKSTALQEQLFFRVVVIVMIAAIVWILFSPSSGVITFFTKRSKLKSKEAEVALIEKENLLLKEKMDRLENDPDYLEEVARTEHSLLKENEWIFDFSKDKPEPKAKKKSQEELPPPQQDKNSK